MSNAARVLFASMIGTTIEFFDFYIYATAAVLVFPRLFFAAGDPTAAVLQSLATFALAFFARPVGSVLFGHFGDRIGRKKTLVASLMTLCRFGQGLGLGGEWGGAVLLAVENAPEGRRARYGMFPQLGAPAGFLCSSGIFLALSDRMTDTQFFAYGWRIPFLASAALVFVGLYVRLRLAETPDFARAIANDERVRVPMLTLWSHQPGTVLLGTFAAVATFVVFYLMTVFSLSWAIAAFGYTRREFLILQMVGVLFLALMIPVSAALADRYGRYRTLIAATVGIMVYGLVYGRLFGSDSTGGMLLFLSLGFALMGSTYGPLGTALTELYPTSVRYTGASLSFNLAGIVGASLAPYMATRLATHYGVAAVGYYLSSAALLTLIALLILAARCRVGRSMP
jgi:MFS family permease